MMKEHPITPRSPYFYAGDDAAIYDDTVRMTDRAYDVIHDVTVRSLHFWLDRRSTVPASRGSLWILDIGCGTGAEAMQVLLRLPDSHLLCVDSSPSMLEQFREKVRRAYGNQSADGRLAFAELDFRERGWLDRAVTEPRELHIPDTFDAAISVYALHHLAPDEKRDVYRAIYERLKAGSLFINADLFAFGTSWLSQMAQEEEEDWINRQFASKTLDSGWMAATLGPSRDRLKEAWLEHLRKENAPLPITTGQSSIDSEPISEERLLRDAGFGIVEVPARLYQSAVLVTSK
jgi:SAM-dependent methyltransferase